MKKISFIGLIALALSFIPLSNDKKITWYFFLSLHETI